MKSNRSSCKQRFGFVRKLRRFSNWFRWQISQSQWNWEIHVENSFGSIIQLNTIAEKKQTHYYWYGGLRDNECVIILMFCAVGIHRIKWTRNIAVEQTAWSALGWQQQKYWKQPQNKKKHFEKCIDGMPIWDFVRNLHKEKRLVKSSEAEKSDWNQHLIWLSNRLQKILIKHNLMNNETAIKVITFQIKCERVFIRLKWSTQSWCHSLAPHWSRK